jgi:peptidoglycan/LPS O-acetylase OafA/YrhL
VVEKARPRGSLQAIDGLRGVAALVVVVQHSLIVLVSGSLALRWFAPQVSRVAVMVFFLLSGFCIHYGQARRAQQPRDPAGPPGAFDLRGYVRRRARRIYPTFVGALALTLLLGLAGSAINPLYFQRNFRYDTVVLVAALFLQGGSFLPVYGANFPLWSLTYEFWFYLLYPMAWLLSARGALRAWVLVTAASAVGLVGVLDGYAIFYAEILAAWTIWYAGALLADIYVGRLRLPGRWLYALVAVGAAVAFVIVGGPVPRRQVLLDYGYAAVAMALLQTLLVPSGAVSNAVNLWVGARLEPLGRMSYSLYLVHFPVLAVIGGWWLSGHDSLPGSPVLALLGIGASVVVAVGFYAAVERHFVSRRVVALSGPLAGRYSPVEGP